MRTVGRTVVGAVLRHGAVAGEVDCGRGAFLRHGRGERGERKGGGEVKGGSESHRDGSGCWISMYKRSWNSSNT